MSVKRGLSTHWFQESMKILQFIQGRDKWCLQGTHWPKVFLKQWSEWMPGKCGRNISSENGNTGEPQNRNVWKKCPEVHWYWLLSICSASWTQSWCSKTSVTEMELVAYLCLQFDLFYCLRSADIAQKSTQDQTPLISKICQIPPNYLLSVILNLD